jgi:alpha-L-fucosidase
MRYLTLFFLLIATLAQAQDLPLPQPRQIAWQKMETTAFLHFSVNTFTDKEWGEGTESPSIFNPTKFDAKQWATALKAAGFKMAILTAKHHDGFCLWPSKYTEHSVKNSPWKNGQGDIVREVADACRAAGLKFGFYLSPWDRHEPSYGTADYNDFYKNQLRELLTEYGEMYEVWFDGARGENVKDMQYDFEGYWAMVRELQPKAVMFSDVGPDVRWVGNEAGNGGETCWSTIITKGMAPGIADASYLNRGDEYGDKWIPAETDVSIRPGWFYHPKEDDKVRSPQNLVNLYYQSVGRNSLLLLNIPPNREGLLSAQDVANIKEFRSILDETFKKNLAKRGKKLAKLTDGEFNTAIPLTPMQDQVLELGKKPLRFDRIALQENILNGQRIAEAKLEYWSGGQWEELTTFSTIGYKRLLRFKPIETNKLRITVLRALKGQVELAEIGIYQSSSRE